MGQKQGRRAICEQTTTQPSFLTVHPKFLNLVFPQISLKALSILNFMQNLIISTAHYFKKDGTLCCIVLKYVYLCVVKGEILVKEAEVLRQPPPRHRSDLKYSIKPRKSKKQSHEH